MYLIFTAASSIKLRIIKRNMDRFMLGLLLRDHIGYEDLKVTQKSQITFTKWLSLNGTGLDMCPVSPTGDRLRGCSSGDEEPIRKHKKTFHVIYRRYKRNDKLNTKSSGQKKNE